MPHPRSSPRAPFAESPANDFRRRSVPLRPAFFVPLVFLTTAVLDTVTTYVGLRWRGGVELNPHTRTDSFMALLVPELVFFAGTLLLCPIAERLVLPIAANFTNENAFREFNARAVKSWRGIAWFLLLLTFVVGAARTVVVLSNLCFIGTGFSPIQALAEWIGAWAKGSTSFGLSVIYGAIGAISSHYLGRMLFSRLLRAN